MELSSYLTNLFSYFIRYVSFLILIPIAGGLNSFVTKFVLAFLFSFFVVFECDFQPIENPNYLYEVLIGFLFSIKVFMKVYVAVIIAEMFDAGRGANSSFVLNPTYGESQSHLSIFAEKYAWLLWLVLGGLEESFKGIIEISYIQVDNIISNNQIFNYTLQMLSKAFRESLPFLFIFLLIDLSICFMAKIFNKWQVNTDIFNIKTFVGFFLFIYFLNS